MTNFAISPKPWGCCPTKRSSWQHGNGERFETYVNLRDAGTGQIQLNAPRPHLGKIGDRITIMNFGRTRPRRPRTISRGCWCLNEKNEVAGTKPPRRGKNCTSSLIPFLKP